MSPQAGSLRFRLAIGLPLTMVMVGASPAFAQMGGMSPGMGPGMGKPGGMAPHEEKDEGPAEVAPDAEEKAPASKSSEASYLEQARRRTKVVEFDGYLRMRTDYLYKMNMGQGYNPGGTHGPAALPPFPVASECLPSGGIGNPSGGLTQSGSVYGA